MFISKADFNRIAVICALPATMLLFGACGEGEDSDANDRGADALNTTSMALSVGASADSDVAGMRYNIKRVMCAGQQEDFEDYDYEHEGALEDLTFPASLPTFEKKPYERESEHLFADHYTVLDAGCYDVVATPLDENGNVSGECNPATARGLVVFDGKTTEAVLISQCEGEARGGLDVAGTLNYPPHIADLAYSPSKFNKACTMVDVCATAIDPDGDPISFEWDTLNATSTMQEPMFKSRTQLVDGGVRECASFGSEEAVALDVKIKIYDEVYDENQVMVTVEDYTGEMSHDSLTFPIYFDENGTCSMTGGNGGSTGGGSNGGDGGGSTGGNSGGSDGGDDSDNNTSGNNDSDDSDGNDNDSD